MLLHFKKTGHGFPIIILHGLYGNSDNWLSVARELAGIFELFLVDARNHGKSPHSKAHTYEAMQSDLLEFMNAHNIEKATIMGHSMGGKTAMLFALLHPERVEKLIVVDIAPKNYKNILNISGQVLEHLNILNAYSAIDVTKIASRADADNEMAIYVQSQMLRHFLLKNLTRNENGHFEWLINISALKNALPDIMDWPHLDKQFPAWQPLQAPTLFVKGEKSDYITNDDFQDLKALFPKADLVSIYDAGHWVHAEQQDLFVKSIRYFLE